MRILILTLIPFFLAMTPKSQISNPDIQHEILREKFTDKAIERIFSLAKAEDTLKSLNIIPCIADDLNCSEKQQYFFDALEILTAQTEPLALRSAIHTLKNLNPNAFSQEEQIRLIKLYNQLNLPHDFSLPSPNEVLSLRSKLLLTSQKETSPHSPSEQVIQDLFYKNPPIENYKDGRYVSKPKIFMFCRHQRQYPCLMLFKDKQGQPLYTKSGKLWTHPSLGYSRKKLPYNEFNGYTPTGIFRVDGVMPEANKQFTFGKNRRLILNFVEKNKAEIYHKWLLPESSHNENWWHQGLEARDIGRGLFRIHGTGIRNFSPKSPFYPFVGTIGCIAQRENTYGKTEYEDQRILLDTLMSLSDMNPVFENEERIRALLYIIEVNDKEGAVTLNDLNQLGIE